MLNTYSTAVVLRTCASGARSSSTGRGTYLCARATRAGTRASEDSVWGSRFRFSRLRFWPCAGGLSFSRPPAPRQEWRRFSRPPLRRERERERGSGAARSGLRGRADADMRFSLGEHKTEFDQLRPNGSPPRKMTEKQHVLRQLSSESRCITMTYPPRGDCCPRRSVEGL